MRKIREVLRLRYEFGLSAREIARSCDIARSTVSDYLFRVRRGGLSWSLPADLDDTALENRLYPSAQRIPRNKRLSACNAQAGRMPPLEYIHRELKRKGVTLPDISGYEYKQANPGGYQYSQFCELYRRWSPNTVQNVLTAYINQA